MAQTPSSATTRRTFRHSQSKRARGQPTTLASPRQRRDSSCSYQSSCGDHWRHFKHCVSRHWHMHPGQRPAVSKVFQTNPHLQNHRSAFFGDQRHLGHRMRPWRARSRTSSRCSSSRSPFSPSRRGIDGRVDQRWCDWRSERRASSGPRSSIIFRGRFRRTVPFVARLSALDIGGARTRDCAIVSEWPAWPPWQRSRRGAADALAAIMPARRYPGRIGSISVLGLDGILGAFQGISSSRSKEFAPHSHSLPAQHLVV